MKHIRYNISSGIFAKCPSYLRGLVVGTNINNSGNAPKALQELRDAEAALSSTTTLEAFIASPQVANWRDAFKQFGMNPGEFRPAHEALGRRALQGKALPDINPAVNVGNALSLRHTAPVGVHPLDDVVSGMKLRLARGDESFIAFGSDKNERPRIGEVVLADGNQLATRCWVWRQAKCSVTLPTTRAIVVNIDAIPPFGENEVLAICRGAEELLRAACGGRFDHYILSVANPAVTLAVP